MKLQHILTTLIIVSASTFTLGHAWAQEKSVNEKIVDTFIALSNGPHQGMRVNHAKGILATGTFSPSDEAKTVTLAPHFQDTQSDVIVRFSNATGVPNIADADPNAMPKGMSIRFLLPEEQMTDIVVLSVERFPVSTPEQFLSLLQAIKLSSTTELSPSPIESFLAENPSAKRFVELEKPAPVSFTTQPYHGLNAFQFENAQGKTVYGRYLIEPVAGNQFLNDKQRKNASADYLMQELSERLATDSAKFKISLQIANPEDVVIDPTVVWPQDRKVVELGMLEINAIMPDGKTYAKNTMFNPLALTDGISPSNDPVLLARPGAYAISFSHRAQ